MKIQNYASAEHIQEKTPVSPLSVISLFRITIFAMAIATHYRVRKYKTAITLQWNDAQVTHSERDLDVLFIYKMLSLRTFSHFAQHDDIIILTSKRLPCGYTDYM